jgi:hypothetical protein
VPNNSVVPSSDRSFYSSRKKPAPREQRRPNGHKAQLALNTQLQHKESQLEKMSKRLEKAHSDAIRAQEQLLAQAVKLRSCETAIEEQEEFLLAVEARLGLSGKDQSLEFRQQAVLDKLSTIRR